jgi:hypothetical protein
VAIGRESIMHITHGDCQYLQLQRNVRVTAEMGDYGGEVASC